MLRNRVYIGFGAGGQQEDVGGGFEGLDEEDLDDGAWGGDPSIDLVDEDAQIAEATGEFDPEDGEEDEEGGWEMEVKHFKLEERQSFGLRLIQIQKNIISEEKWLEFHLGKMLSGRHKVRGMRGR